MPLDNRILSMTPGEVLLDVPMADIVERMARAIARAQVALDQASIQTAVELGETRLALRDAEGVEVARSLLELGFLPTFYQFVETTIEVSVSLTIRVGEELRLGGTLSLGSGGGGGGGTGGTGGTGASGGTGAGGTGAGGPVVIPPIPSGPTGTVDPFPSGPAGPLIPAPSGPAGTELVDLSGGTSFPFASANPVERTVPTASMFGLTLTADYTRRYDFDTTAASKVTARMVAVPAPPAFLSALRDNFRIGT